MEQLRKIWTFCRREDLTGAVLWNLDLAGDRIVLNGREHPIGFVCLPPIDSREDGFTWSRAWLDGTLLDDTMVRIRCHLCDEEEEQHGDFNQAVRNLTKADNPLEKAQSLFGAPISEGTDFLISGEGRYLHLMIELGNTNGEDPEISMLRIQMEADHMTDYLPGIYRDDDFTYRFLSIFDSLVSDLEQQIENVSSQLNKDNCNDEMLGYLASWLCMETSADRKKLQKGMDTALDDYETMYSVSGIKQSVRRLTGHDPLIIEGKDVNPNRAEAGNSDMLRTLYGDDPLKFFVLLAEEVLPTSSDREQFIENMKKRIPAGVEMELVSLKKCVQLGHHTYLGINTVLQGYVPAVIGENTGIYFDTMIGGNS